MVTVIKKMVKKKNNLRIFLEEKKSNDYVFFLGAKIQ